MKNQERKDINETVTKFSMNKNLKNSSRFCMLPFMTLNTRTNGGIKPCSEIQIPLIQKNSTVENIHNNTNGQINLTRHRLDEAWNSEFMVDFRRRMLNEEYIKPCETCYHLEKMGSVSKRKSYNEKFFDDHKNLVQEAADNNGRMTTMPIWWELRFSSICNESCRMCNPKTSSKMREEFSEYVDELPKSVKENTIYSIRDFKKFGYLRDNEFFLDQFYKNLPDIRYLEIHGGEPTTDLKLFEVLKTVTETGYSKNIHLHVHSNIHRLREKDLEIWNQFKSGWLGISIDAYDEENEYIRYGSKWSNIEKNLKMIKSLGPHWKKLIATTVMSYNVCTLDKLISWYISYSNQHELFDLNWLCLGLSTPELMRPEQIPLDVRLKAVPRLKNLLGKHNEYTDSSIRSAISMLESDFTPSKDSFNEFLEYTRILDKKRQQSVTEVFPHFRDIFKND